MRKVKHIIGLKVITFDTGEVIDKVEDVLFDPGEDRILALLVDRGGWLSRAKIVPFDVIKSIGDDAVVIPSRNSVTQVGDDRRVKGALESHKAVSGMQVYTTEGKYLGTIADMVVDETTGHVEGYEVSGGMIKESLKGRNFLPSPETMTIGEKVVFVSPETGYRVEHEVTGGVQGAAQSAADRTRSTMQDTAENVRVMAEEAGENIQQAAGTTRERLSEGATTARERMAETAGTAREHFSELTADQQRRYVVGKRASEAVHTSSGMVIVRRDETITEPMAYQAEREGVLGQLAAAAGGAQARETMGNLRDEASGAFDQMRRTFQDWTQKAQDKTQEERIKGALGRPVSRVILDRNDQVILNTGDIITHQAIQRAEASGQLDILLSSVSKQEPQFGLEERKLHPDESRPKQRRVTSFEERREITTEPNGETTSKQEYEKSREREEFNTGGSV